MPRRCDLWRPWPLPAHCVRAADVDEGEGVRAADVDEGEEGEELTLGVLGPLEEDPRRVSSNAVAARLEEKN